MLPLIRQLNRDVDKYLTPDFLVYTESVMNWTLVSSIIGGVLAVALGVGGILMGWLSVADGVGLALLGLSVLGIHYNLPTSV